MRKTREAAEVAMIPRARFEVVVVGAGGERQNVCFGERYETREEAELAYDTLVADGEIDASARIVEVAS